MRILHAIHDFLPRHKAGSEIYAHDLARHQASKGHEVHILCAEYDPYRSHGSLEWRHLDDLPVTELINNWSFDSFAESYASPALDGQLDHVLAAVAPDVLHIHNLLNLSFNLPAQARARGIPVVATLHEFVLLCPSGGQRVHMSERHVCTEIDPERCARCFTESHFYSQMVYGRVARRAPQAGALTRLAQALRRHSPKLFARAGQLAAAQAASRDRISTDDILQRRKALATVYDNVELFVAPSPALGRDFARFGLPEAKIKVSDYGFNPLGVVARQPRGERLRVGFVGTLVWHKGAHVLVEAVRQLPTDQIEVDIYGDLTTFPDYVAELRKSAEGLPINFRGGFDRSQVREVYGGMDVLTVCSLWPENSPLVIHEAFMAGVPVVGSSMGGTADLVEDGVWGLLYEAQSPGSLASALSRFLQEPSLVERFAKFLPAVKTLEQDAAEWQEVYEELLATGPLRSRADG